MARWRKLFFFPIIFLAPNFWASSLRAADPEPKVDVSTAPEIKVDVSTAAVIKVNVSTAPIGSPFLRHFAYDYKFDLKELVKFEKRGFGRTEIITIALISQKTGKPMKEYGKRRLKTQVPLIDLAKEAGMDYAELYKKARTIKSEIEAQGENNLPPPIFEEKPKEEGKDDNSRTVE